MKYSFTQHYIDRLVLPATSRIKTVSSASATLHHGIVWPDDLMGSVDEQFLNQGMFLSMLMTAYRMCLIFQQYITGFKDELRNVRVIEKR